MTIRFRRLTPHLYCLRVYAPSGDLTAQFVALIDRGNDRRWRLYRPVPTPDNPNRTETTHLTFPTRKAAMAYVVTVGL